MSGSSNNLYKKLKIGSSEKGQFINENALSFQHPYTALSIGKTGAGKTSIVLSNLFLGTPDPNHNGIVHSNVAECIVFTGQTSLDDPLYNKMAELYPDNFELKSLHDFPAWVADLKARFDEIKQEGGGVHQLSQTLVVFDDFLHSADLTKQVFGFATYCRKLNCSMVSICQSFTQIDKLVRDNSKYLILCGEIPRQQIIQIYQLISMQVNINRDEFISLYRWATDLNNTTTKDKLDAFMVIDLRPECPINERFRQTFTKFLAIKPEVPPIVDPALVQPTPLQPFVGKTTKKKTSKRGEA